MKKLILFAVLTITSSCAVNYKMPDNRFETPEANGGFGKSKLSFGGGSGKSVELTSDYSQVWVDTQNPGLKEDGFVNLGGSMGVAEKFDLGLEYISDLGLVFKGKFHFFGKPKEHGAQLALVVKGGGGSEEKSETSNTPTSVDLRNTFIGFDAIFGWRFGKSFLAYTSVFHDEAQYDVTQKRGTTTNKYKGKSENFGGTLGIDFDMSDKLDLILEFSRAKVESGMKKLTLSAFGGNLGISF